MQRDGVVLGVPAQKAIGRWKRFAGEERDQGYSALTRAPLSCGAGFVHRALGCDRRDGGWQDAAAAIRRRRLGRWQGFKLRAARSDGAGRRLVERQ
jgi:hypothetical protein